MRDASTIKEALERNVKAVSLRASVGQGTATTRATLRDGLACDVEEGAYKVSVGMNERFGGSSAAPSPGVIGRASLASCLTLGIAMWAARMDVAIDALEVEVQADYDARGEFGVSSDVMPGYSEMRYAIRISSPAPEAAVRKMLETAVKTSSYVDNFTRAVSVKGSIQITRS